MNMETPQLDTTDDACDGAIWCATLTFAKHPANPLERVLVWHPSSYPGSSLSDTDFTYKGVEYTVGSVNNIADANLPHLSRFGINFGGSSLREDHYRDWTIYVDGLALPFSPERIIANGSIMWRHPKFYDFRVGTPVELRIEASEKPVSEETVLDQKPPTEPRYLMVRPLREDALGIWWEEPSFDGWPDVVLNLSDVDEYRIQWKEATGSWDIPDDVSELTVPAWQYPGGSNFYDFISGLTEGVEYSVRVIAANEAGDSPPSKEATGTPAETTPPTLEEARVDGTDLTLTYDEALDENAAPPTAAFSVLVNGASRAADGVSVSGRAVTLTLSSAVAAEDVVKVKYAAPIYVEEPRIRDMLGNPASSLIGRRVTNDTLSTSQSTSVNNPNSAPTGVPVIVGAPLAGQTLTADTSNIADDNGLTTATFSYQWLFSDSGVDTEIPNATESTYTLVADDEGKAIKVRVSFSDDAGHEETVTSLAVLGAAVSPVSQPNAAAAGAPTISGTAQVGETLTASASGISDEDGLENVSFDYQWLADDEEIQDATGSAYTLGDSDEGKPIRVRVSFTDDDGNQETLVSEATGAVAARPNSPATGAPTISGTVQVGETLTASTAGVADSDGMDNATFTYQWIADDSDIAGATDSIYALVTGDEGKSVEVRVSFTDDADNKETLTSEPTVAVAGQPSAPLTAVIENAPETHDGSSEFTFELRFSEEVKLSYKTLRDHAFTVSGGTVKKAKRLEQGDNIHWLITIEPDSNTDVTIVLPATTDCGDQGAICTEDGRRLSNRLELTVRGPGQ